jgi:hypothetical protein
VTQVSPLGRYSAIVAALVAVGLIAAAIVYRMVYREGDQWLDGAALIAIGAVFAAPVGLAVGARQGESAAAAKINGLGAQVAAANIRLDAAGAPPASVAAAQLGVPAPIDSHDQGS